MTDEEKCTSENTSEEAVNESEEIKEQTANTEGADDCKSEAAEADKHSKEYDELNDRYMRVIAEYDNYRKRTLKERDGIYADAYIAVLKEILPVLDNLERAAAFTDNDKVSSGVVMTVTSFKEALKKLGVEEIEALNAQFDPTVHNAVMHVEDENFGENVVVDVFQKGYRKGDKILRYAMVKVAN